MKKEEIHLFDIKRILFGQTPPEFMLEVLVRTLIIYLATLVVLRLVGKRMSGQLTIIEFSLLLMMGAIVSLPMQAPDRGILQGLLILLFILGLYRGINLLAFNNNKVEKLIQGDLSLLVKDGVIVLPEMEKSKISRQQLYSVLRTRKIYNLGKVKRMYLEACGIFSVYEYEQPRPGLPVLPPDDQKVLEIHNPDPDSKMACCKCGSVQTVEEKDAVCNNCGNIDWVKAAIE